MRVTIVVRYSGQQKSPTSSVPATPGPPPADNPKPCPRAPVTAPALPACVSGPRVGVRPRASSGACLIAVDDAFAAFAPGAGTVISGAAAAGGRTASFGALGGVCAWTGRPLIGVRPPLCGPSPPPPSVIVIMVAGSGAVWDD